ncbi:YqgQ family protein [Aneurinibacillus aneurinilyticus]|uniref:YqgQ family protein n=1 Tax=Aneurinibacillus aneurinilyticus TaxID=1391 RepID=A0A848CWD8_ANEAE|nr:YqgQ family protein [Aneurinibacillus aneurinilyticus]MCI1695128.1 YqgQ family protein [Aneurinibacillus aneurinilyticus]MED0704610.1 YqgQ family protein [Aneurinibacillus aneurinilyticus]MED0721542.1 YqgQ family protein [Aneurinibacillus aneurinilyticus]MED0734810.1 YqgQ family protein [Aneurinibacillus aneurinilyticus]MED0742445.1 YqgQ family protein [Aneurinibacillus aneurinilyticus]
MNNILDVKALLRRFGIVIYMGDRLTDYEMWEEELRELYQESMIDMEEFRAAMMILQKAKRNDVDV